MIETWRRVPLYSEDGGMKFVCWKYIVRFECPHTSYTASCLTMMRGEMLAASLSAMANRKRPVPVCHICPETQNRPLASQRAEK